MKKIFLLLALFSFNTTDVMSQWFWQNPLPQGSHLYSVDFVSADTGWAAGSFGTILKTTNGGKSWIPQVSGINDPEFNIRRIRFFDSMNGVAYGNRSFLRPYYVIKTSDGGESWEKIFESQSVSLESISLPDSKHGWITARGSQYGYMLKTTDAGASWETTSSDIRYHTMISFVDSINGFSIGSTGYLFRTSDGGTSWIETSDLSAKPYYFKDIIFTDSEHGTITGDNDSLKAILTTSDGGITWKDTLFRINHWSEQFREIIYIDRSRGIIVGNYGVIMTTTDAGQTWISRESGTSQHLTAVSASGINMTAVGYNGTILGSIDSGLTWNNLNKGMQNTLYDVFFSDNIYGTVVGSEGTVLRTTDGGTHWILQEVPDSSILTSVYFSDKNTGTIAGLGIILRTTDGGNKWYAKYFDDKILFTDVHFTDIKNGIVVGYTIIGSATRDRNIIMRTSDGGETWETHQNQYSGSEIHWLDIFYIDSLNVRLLGRDENVEEGTLLISSTDGGDTWSQMYYSHSFVNGMYFNDADTGIIIGNYPYTGDAAFILRTINGGADWKMVHFESDAYLTSISFTDPYNGLVTGRYGMMLRTTDAGRTWFHESSMTSKHLYSVSYVKSSATAVGSEGTIIRNNFLPVSGVWLSEQEPAEYSLKQNYPNPFNPTTTIKYSLPHSGRVTLSIYDLLGREVVKLIDEEKPAGEYETQWIASSYPSGVYFLKMQAGQFTQTRKLLLVK